MASNLKKLCLFQFLWMSLFTTAIITVFYSGKGLSILNITTLDVVWAIVAFVLEVPTGALSDRWSRKYMLALSGVWMAAGMTIYLFGNSFIPFAFAVVFMAMRNSFVSGTLNALLYDTLSVLNKSASFEKNLGNIQMFGTAGVVAAGILGAFLATIDIRLPFIATIIFALLSSLVALTVKEPQIHSSTNEVKYFQHIKESIRFLLTHPVVKVLLFYIIFMDIAISHLDEYDQLYLQVIGFPLVYFGVWIGVRRLLRSLGGMFAHRVKGKIKYMQELSILIMIISLITISLGNIYVGLATFLLIFFLYGIIEILTLGELHSKIKSSNRATVESLVVFVGVLIDIPVRIIFGYLGDLMGIKFAYLFISIILLVYGVYFILNRYKLNIFLKQGSSV